MMKMIFFNSPVSCSCLTSSAPPMKTVGKVNFVFSLFNASSSAIRFRNSLRNLESIDKPRSSIDTRKPRKIDWTVRQASNIDFDRIVTAQISPISPSRRWRWSTETVDLRFR
ncbi:hypothetical protein Hanom_Chr10g00925851 [Helianthus anomalus]